MIFKRIGQTLRVFFHLMRVFWQMTYGFWKISKLQPPIITIFGSSKLAPEDPYAVQAHQLAQMFINQDIDILTGGGPGIMQAASCAAFPVEKGKGISIGIGVKGLAETKDPCVSDYFELNYFFARKWLLTKFSIGFVFFPGGFGTFDELAEVLTLISTKQTKKVPVVLVGTQYWGPLMTWVKDEVFTRHKAITDQDLALIEVTDDLNRAFSLVCVACKVDKP